jgi:glutamate-1-semialdehyde aminotransferase
MAGVSHTWISSTLSTEFVSLAAAKATLAVVERERVPSHLARVGGRLLAGLRKLRDGYPDIVAGAAGIAEMCFLHFTAEEHAQAAAIGCAKRGVLFKRSAYDFVSLAHDAAAVDRTLGVLEEVLAKAM